MSKFQEVYPKVKGVLDKRTGVTHLKGENPVYDMIIHNMALLPEGSEDYKDYELIFFDEKQED